MRSLFNRIRPFGAVRPNRLTRAHLAAWRLGVRDGWNQPRELSTSTNVDHLDEPGDEGLIQDSLDRGINLGQWIRSPLNHQQREIDTTEVTR